nr:MAG TPA: hypothetical protein [Caudoviricetes sp.]
MLISIFYTLFNANAIPGRCDGYQRHFSMTKWQKCHTSVMSRTDKNVILLSLCHTTDISLI